MFNDRQRLLVLLLQPFLIAVLLYIVSDENIFSIYESTKSMLFALSCSGIWIGLFNSIQEICKERPIVKREYMANLRLPGYILSKFSFQFLLGGVQAAILAFLFLSSPPLRANTTELSSGFTGAMNSSSLLMHEKK